MSFTVKGAFRDALEESLSSEHVTVLSKLDKPMLDAKLSDKVGLESTRVRTILNDLHEKRLVSLKRTKGPKEGWFSYYWSRREDNIKGFVSKYIDEKLNHLSGKLDAGADTLTYSCGCSSVDYGTAIEMNFTCSLCGQPFTNQMKRGEAREINTEIRRLNELKNKAKIM